MQTKLPALLILIALLFHGTSYSQNVTFGLFTDMHYTSQPGNQGQFNAQGLSKLRECIDTLNRSEASFVVELGDVINKGERTDAKQADSDLEMVANELARFDGRKYFVTGTQDAGIAKTKPYQEAMQKNRIKAGGH